MIGELEFKGERNYLHGTDIFNVVAASCDKSYGPGFLCFIEFRRFTDRQIRLTSDTIGNDESKIGSCIYECASGEAKKFDLVATAVPVRGCYAYDESRIVAPSRVLLAERAIISPKVEDVSAIEQIIALDKKLHYALCPSPPGRWVFTRLRCVRAIPVIETDCRITVDRMLPNKFSESEVQINGDYIGKITFTAAP